jgi:hypothetical protein
MAMLDGNITALQQRISAPLLGVVPHQQRPDAIEIARCLDLRLLLNVQSPERAEQHD